MNKQQGFTLIEIIVVLILLGIMSVLAGIGISTGLKGYLIASENAEITQKAQLAMTRLAREIRQCANCDSSNTYPDPFDSFEYSIFDEDDDYEIKRKLELDSGALKLGLPDKSNDMYILVDQVENFNMSRNTSTGVISIELEMSHPYGATQTFGIKILPRNS